MSVESIGTVAGHGLIVMVLHLPFLQQSSLINGKRLEQSSRAESTPCQNGYFAVQTIGLYRSNADEIPRTGQIGELTAMASKAKGKKGKTKQAKVDPLDRVPRPKVRKRAELEPFEEDLMKALSHPLRVQILTLVNGRAWSPNEISKELDEGLSQVSYHVKVLRDFKVIELTNTEPRRGAVEHYYKAVERILVREKIADKLPKTARVMLRDRIIQDADQDIQEALEAGTFYQRKDIHADWAPVDLDDRACKALSKRADKFLDDVAKITGDAATRIADGAEAIPMSLALFAFVSARGAGKSPTHGTSD